MKRNFSLILALVMLLSTLSYAAPTMVGTVETTQEVAVDAAEVFKAEAAEETTDAVAADEAQGLLIYSIDFDALNDGNLGDQTIAPTNMSETFPSATLNVQSGNGVVEAKTTNSADKVVKVAYTGSNYSRWVLSTGVELPDGNYRIEFDIKVDSQQGFKTGLAKTTNETTDIESFSATTNWTTVGFSFDGYKKASVTNVAKLFQCFQDGSNKTWYFDNLKIYYQGQDPATVTFSSSVEATVPAAVTNVLPGTKLDLSDYKATVADENKVFFGWSLTEGGAVVTELEVLKDTTLYAVYRDAFTETHPTYGQLAYWVDFDNGALTGAKIDYYKTTTKVVKAPAGMPDAYGLSVVTFNSGTTPKIADGTMQTDGGYPRFYLSTDAENPFPEGYYTVVWGAKTDVAVSNILAVWGSSPEYPNTVGTGSALTADYVESVSSFKYVDDKATGANGSKDNLGGLQNIGLYFPLTTDTTDNRKLNRYVDYMKVYYTPFYDVTFDANGKDVAVPTSVTDIHKIKLADYTCQTAGTSRFVGWSATPNGKLITEEEIVISSDTTLYAVWDDNFEPSAAEADAGYLLANLHFNGKANTDNTNSQIFSYGTVGKNEYVSGNSFPKVNPGDANGRIWFDGSGTAGDSTSKFLYDEAHKDNEYVKTASKQSGTEVYPKVGVVLYSGSLADGIYTVASEIYIPAGQENVASVTYNAYVYAGGDKVANKHDISIGERVYVVDSILVLNGEVYDPETMERKGTFTVGTNNVEKFGLNFNVKADDSTKPTTVSVHADNFKIYYKPYTYAPKSYNENSIRVNSPSGIRFKASVSTLERNHNELTEYGYIVARKVTLSNLGVAENELKMENTALTKGTHYVQGVSYGMVDGKKVDRIFEKNGNVTFFTAVVYNIPSNMYDDVIVVRPYVMLGETAVYGEPMTASIYEVAQKIAASDSYEDYKTAVDKILNGEEL